MPQAAAVGLDLGTTRIKAGILDGSGGLRVVASAPAPPLAGDGLIREGVAEAYLDAARRVLAETAAAGVPRGTPLGIAAQRSSFLLWDRETGAALTPLISWQDRRAADWCSCRAADGPEVTRRTGLLLSAHYAGPKLAVTRAAEPELARALDAGRAVFGTLESRLLWYASHGGCHATDLSMAARTLMVDIDAGEWASALLELYGVPRCCLPTIAPTAAQGGEVEGLAVSATVADQAAGALAVLDARADDALVTLGTGAFVLRAAAVTARVPGYLTAPILGSARGAERSVLEGTINGAGAALDGFPADPTRLPERDPSPDAFCVPDVAGLGSPSWRPEVGLTLSEAAAGLGPVGRRRAVLEGLVFRVRQVLRDLFPGSAPRRVVLSGGVSAQADLVAALAAALGRPVEVLLEREAGLVGAARLAAGLEPWANPPTREVPPGREGAYLERKYARWREWLEGLLSGARR